MRNFMAGFIHQAFLWHAFVANDVPRDDMLFRFNVSPYKWLYQ